MRRAGALGLWGVACAVGCADPVGALSGEHGDCALVAVNSDYQSTSVALLNSDGSLCLEPVIHSGSARAGLVTALSGDVVLPSTSPPGGLIRLIDRYPNAVLTTLDASGHLLSQVSVATGFAANPQDCLDVGDELWVSRLATNPTPGREALDGGGDLLRLRDGAVVGRIALDAAATGDNDPMPGALAPIAGGVAVGLSNLRRDFRSGGEGRVALVRDGAPLAVVAIPSPYANCGGVARLDDGRLAVICTGVFADGDRVPTSGLALVDPEAASVVAHVPASALGAALAFSVTPVDGARVLAVLFGDLGAGTPDRVVIVDLASGAVTPTGVLGPAFTVGQPLLPVAGGAFAMWVPAGDRGDPRVRRFAGLSAADEGPSFNASPAVGLPTRQLAWRRD